MAGFVLRDKRCYFFQRSSLIRHLLSVIFSPSEIISYDILPPPLGQGLSHDTIVTSKENDEEKSKLVG